MPDEDPEETAGTVVQLRAEQAPTEAALAEAPAPAYLATPGRVPGERLPVIPLHLRGRANLRATLVLAGAQNWHRARYHGVRSLFYLVAVLVWAVIGLVRLAGRQIAWWWVIEQEGLRSQAAADGNAAEWMRLHKQAKQDRHLRGMVLGGELITLAIAGGIMAKYGPWWAWTAGAAIALPLLARAGRPDGMRIVGTAIVPPNYSPPTHEIISRALGSLGIAQISAVLKPDKDGRVQGINFISDVMQSGPGWSCHLDLPHGVSVSSILAKREDLASGLRRPLSATWPSGVPEEHPGRMDLWVGFHDISKMKPPVWPLLKARSTDVFGPLPFGTDPRLRPVGVPMFEMNWLIGAAPGQAKTTAMRGLACGVALDILAEEWVHELAGKGDLEALAQVCHRYCSGLDDEAIAYTAESLRLLRTELDRRSVAMKSVPKEQRPQGKITRELAAQRHLRLHPLVCFIDEAQNLFMHPQYGDQAREDAAYVIRLGRAYGVILVLATQRPDAKTMPTSVTGNIVCRFCLQVPGQPENDMILGTSAYRGGYDSTVFRPGVDAGLGWLKADGPPQIVRIYKVDLEPAEKVAARARDMRDRAGMLTGYALGELEVTEKRDVLADVQAVFGDAPGLHWAELADRLAGRWPDRWADITGETVSSQCRALGVPSVDVRMSGVTLKGCRRVAVQREAAR